jgi:hypothetical protein
MNRKSQSVIKKNLMPCTMEKKGAIVEVRLLCYSSVVHCFSLQEEMEKGFYIPPCSGIPKYAAENDPYCPLAQVRKFNDKQKLKLKEALKTSDRSKHFVESKLQLNVSELAFPATPSLKSSALSNAFYPNTQAQHQLDMTETEILQTIIIRERLLSELMKIINSGSDISSLLSEVVEMVKAVRFETVDVIESIARWKSQQAIGRPFLFKGVNYLLKMMSDLDFLDNYDDIIERFGFEFRSNPLAYKGGGNIISVQGSAFRIKDADNYLQGLLKSYYDGPIKAVDGTEVVRLHNAEKVIREELFRIAQQASVTVQFSESSVYQSGLGIFFLGVFPFLFSLSVAIPGHQKAQSLIETNSRQLQRKVNKR